MSITVKVGDGDNTGTWTLPQDVLTHASPFFNAALSHTWLESETKQIELKEDSPSVFRFFLHWLYQWILNEDGKYPKRITHDLEGSIYLDAWVLGDKIRCPRFQDFAIAHLRSYSFRKGLYPALVQRAYDNSPPGSKIRYFVACLMNNWLLRPGSFSATRDHWSNLIQEMDDLAKDMVLLQKHNDIPFNFLDVWPGCFLVSSKNDFQFDFNA